MRLILLEALGWTFALLCTVPDVMSAHQHHVIKLCLKTMRSQLSTANKQSFHIKTSAIKLSPNYFQQVENCEEANFYRAMLAQSAVMRQ